MKLGIHPFHEKIMNHRVIKWPDTILNLPNYDLLADLIERANLSMSPAELHGLATGLLVADTSASENRFLKLVCEEPEQGDVLAVENTQLLLALFQATQEALQTITLEFELLVPDDDEPLADRIDAACEWARSLLYGLAEQFTDHFLITHTCKGNPALMDTVFFCHCDQWFCYPA